MVAMMEHYSSGSDNVSQPSTIWRELLTGLLPPEVHYIVKSWVYPIPGIDE
jgi:hypothetical protein